MQSLGTWGEKMETVFKTDCGRKRTRNEDSGSVFHQKSGQFLAVVADGMGGHLAGDVASKMALDFFKDKSQTLENKLSKEESVEWLKETIVGVNAYIYEHATNHEQCKGMGTTVVAAYCDNHFVSVAHVGDSRCYLLNNDGLSQITTDHTLVNELVKTGLLSKEDAENHPKKNVILRALGTEENIEVDTTSFDWQTDQILLLCSDGLTDKVNDQEIEAILKSLSSMENKAEQLIAKANHAGGEDNITLTIVGQTNGESNDR